MAGDRPQCLMLDADIIIFLHAAGLWDALITSYQVVVPSIVAREACYYRDQRHERQPIDLLAQIAAGQVCALTASSDELTALLRRFNADPLEGLHPGEQEALALILSRVPSPRVASVAVTAWHWWPWRHSVSTLVVCPSKKRCRISGVRSIGNCARLGS